MPARQYRSTVQAKTLSVGINNSIESMTLGPDTLTLPSTYPYTMVIDPDLASEEIVTVLSSPSAGTFTISRGQDGTSKQAHTASAVVKHMITPRDLQDAQNHIEAASGGYTTTNDGADLGVTGPTIPKSLHGIASGEGSVVGTLKTQTLTNKTINLTNNTLTGTTAQFNTALSDANFATTALLEARVPTGSVNMWITGSAPSGWLLCDGSAVSRTTYSALWDVLRDGGSTSPYGNGDGSTTFNLPDLLGRVPMGAGAGTGLTSRTLGTELGVESVTLSINEMPSHGHANNVGDGAGAVNKTSFVDRNASHDHTTAGGGDHQHNINTAIEIAGSLANDTQVNWLINAKTTGGNYLVTTAGDGPHNHGINGTDTNHRHDIAAQGGGAAHTNIQPSTVVNFIIKH